MRCHAAHRWMALKSNWRLVRRSSFGCFFFFFFFFVFSRLVFGVNPAEISWKMHIMSVTQPPKLCLFCLASKKADVSYRDQGRREMNWRRIFPATRSSNAVPERQIKKAGRGCGEGRGERSQKRERKKTKCL